MKKYTNEEFTISNDNFVGFQDDFYALLEKYGVKNINYEYREDTPKKEKTMGYTTPKWTIEMLELELQFMSLLTEFKNVRKN